MSEKLGNISSVVITLKANANKELLQEQISHFASIEAQQDDKIVALIETDDIDGQIAAFRSLERLDGVWNISMIYSYEDPADTDAIEARSMQEIMEKIENTKIKDIKYGGHPRV